MGWRVRDERCLGRYRCRLRGRPLHESGGDRIGRAPVWRAAYWRMLFGYSRPNSRARATASVRRWTSSLPKITRLWPLTVLRAR